MTNEIQNQKYETRNADHPLIPPELTDALSNDPELAWDHMARRIHEKDGYLFACDGRIAVRALRIYLPDVEQLGCSFKYDVVGDPRWNRAEYGDIPLYYPDPGNTMPTCNFCKGVGYLPSGNVLFSERNELCETCGGHGKINRICSVELSNGQILQGRYVEYLIKHNMRLYDRSTKDAPGQVLPLYFHNENKDVFYEGLVMPMINIVEDDHIALNEQT